MANRITLATAAAALIVIAGGYYLLRNPGDPARVGLMEITFANNSGAPLAAVEYSPAGQGVWQAVAVPEGRLGPGETIVLLLPDGEKVCDYDLRITGADGTVALRPGVNLCAVAFYHFRDE